MYIDRYIRTNPHPSPPSTTTTESIHFGAAGFQSELFWARLLSFQEQGKDGDGTGRACKLTAVWARKTPPNAHGLHQNDRLHDGCVVPVFRRRPRGVTRVQYPRHQGQCCPVPAPDLTQHPDSSSPMSNALKPPRPNPPRPQHRSSTTRPSGSSARSATSSRRPPPRPPSGAVVTTTRMTT